MKFTPRLRSIGVGLAAVTALGAGCTAAPNAIVKTDNYANQFDRFPVVGSVSYQNDYGASRGGGTRSHAGVDLMANVDPGRSCCCGMGRAGRRLHRARHRC